MKMLKVAGRTLYFDERLGRYMPYEPSASEIPSNRFIGHVKSCTPTEDGDYRIEHEDGSIIVVDFQWYMMYVHSRTLPRAVACANRGTKRFIHHYSKKLRVFQSLVKPSQIYQKTNYSLNLKK